MASLAQARDRLTHSGFIAELRSASLQTAGNGEDVIFTGSPIVFNSWSELLWSPRGSFRERILPGAFDEALDGADVRLLSNHDESSVMARTKSGTLDLTVDGEALRVWARLDPSDPDVQRLQPKVRRGDIDQMSFTFEFDPDAGAKDHWYRDAESNELRRDVIKVSGLFDVSPVTFPAYLDTSVSLRSMERAIKSGGLGEAIASKRNRYERVIQLARETPWAILPSSLALIFEILSARAAGERLTPDELADRIGTRRERPQPDAGPVAVLGLYGPIFPRANLMTEVSGATSVQEFQSELQAAVNDPSVASILIDVDSPGGLVDLVPELASEVRAARAVKPIVAHANTLAASAAYWIASAASEIVVTPSGEVGSIGVYAAHQDMSGFQEKAGVKTTLVSAGKYKTEANPFEPLSDEAKAAIQRDVDEFYRMFTSAVAKGRGVSVEQVRAGFGEGRVVGARDALTLGMVDRIASFDETLARLQAGVEGRSHAAPRLQRRLHNFARQENAELDDLPESAFATRWTLRSVLGLAATGEPPSGQESEGASARAERDPAVGSDRDASAGDDPPVGGSTDAIQDLRARTRAEAEEARREVLRTISSI